METCEPCLVSVAEDVSCRWFNICAWKCSLLFPPGESLLVSCPMRTKTKSMHYVLQFLLIYELKLAVCVFSPLRSVGILKTNVEMVEWNALQKASSCFQQVKTSHWCLLSCTWCLLLMGISKINLFLGLVLPLWCRPCWDSSRNPLECPSFL